MDQTAPGEPRGDNRQAVGVDVAVGRHRRDLGVGVDGRLGTIGT